MKKVPCLVYSRVCGYFAEVNKFNFGKKQEFKDRVNYNITKSLASEHAGEGMWPVRMSLAEEGVLHG